MNTITISFAKEDRKLLEDLLGSITLLASVIGSTQPQEVREKIIAEVTETVADENPVTAPTIETPAPVAEPTEEVKPVSLAEFQKAVTLAVTKGAEAKKIVKEIINKYATSVSAVPEDKRAEIMAELSNI